MGAAGGIDGLSEKTGGKIYLTKGDVLYIYVGQEGTDSNVSCTSYGNKYNGGGIGGYLSDSICGSDGGGATDIRLTSGTWDDSTSLNSRIMVASGGAGASSLATYPQNTYTSGLTGIYYVNSTYQSYMGNSGTQLSGGAGGGGYYGGSGGSGASNGTFPGAGGSSFISGYAGVNAITSSSSTTATYNTIHYSGMYFVDGYMTSGISGGNGTATITYISNNEPTRTNTKLNGVRYIKDCTNGSSGSTNNLWVELQAITDGINVAKGKTVTGTSIYYGSNLYSYITDGDIVSTNYGRSDVTGYQCITVDLDGEYDLDEVAIWHYWADGRTFYSNTTYVSSDNSNWTPIIANSDAETSNGKRVSAWDSNATVTPIFRVSNMVVNGGFENGSTNWTLSNTSVVSTYYYSGTSSLRFATGVLAMSTQDLSVTAPTYGHIYYGALMFLSSSTFTVGDNRYEWYYSDVENSGRLVFAAKNISTTSWTKLSSIKTLINSDYTANTWKIRNFLVSASDYAYADNLILIDLTSTFGSGEEPTQAWCDANLSYFDGTQTLNLSP